MTEGDCSCDEDDFDESCLLFHMVTCSPWAAIEDELSRVHQTNVGLCRRNGQFQKGKDVRARHWPQVHEQKLAIGLTIVDCIVRHYSKDTTILTH